MTKQKISLTSQGYFWVRESVEKGKHAYPVKDRRLQGPEMEQSFPVCAGLIVDALVFSITAFFCVIFF